MRIILAGYEGHMGREVRASADCTAGADIVMGVDPMIPANTEKCVRSFADCGADADVIIDFSHHSMTRELLQFALKKRMPLVLATTGQTEEEKKEILEAAKKIPLFLAANYSLGIAVLTDLVKKALLLYPDAEVEIVEQHHDRKLDAPSGTALALFDAVREIRPDARAVKGREGQGKRRKEDVGIHAIRMGNIVGIHEVIIGTQNETLTLRHQAAGRGVFADGSLKAAAFLIGKKPGLYNMKDLLQE